MNGGKAFPTLVHGPYVFIQSQNIFVGSLQNETNHNLKQTDPVTVNITAIFRISNLS